MDVVWSKELACGNAVLDREHREILHVINRLLPLLKGDVTLDPAHELLYELESYASHHFLGEEEQMWATQYPEVFHHLEDHRRLGRFVADLKSELHEKVPSRAVLLNTVRLLANAIKTHIHTHDTPLAAFLRLGSIDKQTSATSIRGARSRDATLGLSHPRQKEE